MKKILPPSRVSKNYTWLPSIKVKKFLTPPYGGEKITAPLKNRRLPGRKLWDFPKTFVEKRTSTKFFCQN